MRVFISVNLEEETNNKIDEISKEIESVSEKGRFIEAENRHITLLFIGEINSGELGKIIDSIEDTDFKPFDINIEGIDRFRRNSGDLYYLKIGDNKILEEINRNLRQSLRNRGIGFDNKKFKPHITIGRDVVCDYGRTKSIKFKPIKIKVKQINLMETVKFNNKIKYRVIY